MIKTELVHSSTHPHYVEGDITEIKEDESFILEGEGQLTHATHESLYLCPGKHKIGFVTQFNPFTKLLERIRD